MNQRKLGIRIREERKRLNFTQAQLAEVIDVSSTYMGAIERGERCPTLDTLIKIASSLSVTVDYLLADFVSAENNDELIVNQFRQLIYGRTLEDKKMAIDVIKTMYSYL